MNKSDWLYDVTGGGTLLMLLLASVMEQLLQNLALRICQKIIAIAKHSAKKEITAQLKQKCATLTQQYKCPTGSNS